MKCSFIFLQAITDIFAENQFKITSTQLVQFIIKPGLL